MECYGIKQICRIHTGWRVKRVGGRIVGATPMAKVTADWRGVWSIGAPWQRGCSVMAEAKERGDRLVWSDLAKHQHTALAEHAAMGGLSLVVAIYEDRTVAILNYPCANLQKGKLGIDSTEAKLIALWWRIAP